MGKKRRNDAFERLLSEGGSDDLARLVDRTRQAYVGSPTAEQRERHLASIIEHARDTETSVAAVPVVRRRVMRALLGTMAGKLAAASLVAALATGALASTGTLPGPAQDVVANFVASTTGVDLPGGDERQRPEQAEDGKATAQQNKDAAASYTEAVRAWTDCVNEQARKNETPDPDGEEPEGDPESDPGSDPEGDTSPAKEACGDKPEPADHGLSGPPSQADHGQETAEEAKDKQEPDADEDEEGRAEDGGTENRPDDVPPPNADPRAKTER